MKGAVSRVVSDHEAFDSNDVERYLAEVVARARSAKTRKKNIVPIATDRRLVKRLPVDLGKTTVAPVDQSDRIAALIGEPLESTAQG